MGSEQGKVSLWEVAIENFNPQKKKNSLLYLKQMCLKFK